MKTHYNLIEEKKKENVAKTTYTSEQLFYMMEVRNSVWNAQTAEIRYAIIFLLIQEILALREGISSILQNYYKHFAT